MVAFYFGTGAKALRPFEFFSDPSCQNLMLARVREACGSGGRTLNVPKRFTLTRFLPEFQCGGVLTHEESPFLDSGSRKSPSGRMFVSRLGVR